ncbi:MAG: hypothetical protein KAS73_02350 [Candidatus Sabulitectum sp.]|nr:hypothetical protein [Candidatus Sabulitectum sp.]
MTKSSARFNTGHFFLTAMVVLFLGISAGCKSDKSPAAGEMALPETGDVQLLIQFSEYSPQDSMPASAVNLPYTASGWFYPSESNRTDYFQTMAGEADAAGKLLFLILLEGELFSGTRDHLIIWINSDGIPVEVMPEIDSELLSDSLWRDPVVRQETILQLIHFFKPDMILQMIPNAEASVSVVDYWSENTIENNFTAALFSLPDAGNSNRGWGAFAGVGIKNRFLEGMDIQGFMATFKLIAGMNWNSPGCGYPAMQAFYATETE